MTQSLNHHINVDNISLPIFGLMMDKIFQGSACNHQHQKGQLLYAIEGLMHVYLKDTHFIVPPTTAVWIPPNVNHVITSSMTVKYRSVYFDCNIFQTFPDITTVIHVTPLLQALILRVCEFKGDYQFNGPEFRIGHVICDEILCAVTSPFSIPISKERRLIKIFAYLKTHIGSNETINNIAKKFGLSTRTLTRLCKKEFGLNFDEWRLQLKLLTALGFLSEGKTTSYISQALGYSNDSAFICMFKRLTGFTPSMFRKQNISKKTGILTHP